MQAFLKTLELWEVTGGNEHMLRELLATRRTTGTGVNATTTIIPVPAAEMAQYHAAYDAWNKADNKADGALTLRLAPHLWQYRRFTARSTWLKLAAVFSEKPPAKWDNEAQLEEQRPNPSSVLQQPGPSQQQQQKTAPNKCQGGRQEREKRERCAHKKQQPHPVSAWWTDEDEPLLAPSDKASPPLKAASLLSSVASLGLNRIENRNVSNDPSTKPTLSISIPPVSSGDLESVYDSPSDPNARCILQRWVSLAEESVHDSPSDPNARRILQCWVSPAEDGKDECDPYNFETSDSSDDDCPHRIGTLKRRMLNDDYDIVDVRKSGHEQKIPVRPDNDKQNPVDLHQEDRHCALGKQCEDVWQDTPTTQ